MKSKKSRYYDDPETATNSQGSKGFLDYAKMAAFGAIFILGLVIGIAFSSGTNLHAASIDSTIAIDQKAPNPELCQQFGASAMVTDMRVFVTLKPFNVFVTQPTMQPGCVLRHNNLAILERQGAIESEELNACKRRMNTFGFTEPLDGTPKVDCVYKNNSAGNLFVKGEDAHAPWGNSDIF